MKKLALLCVLLSLVVVGCGKKTHKDHTKSKTSKSRSIKKNKNLALKDTEDFFDKDAVSEFAFVDDEKSQKTEEKENLALAEADLTDDESLTEDDGPTCSFKTVHFDLNGDGIRNDQKAVVEEDSTIAKDAVANGKKVVVQGHCCQLGSHAYNLALSQRRAETIKQELVSRGLAEEEIKTVGYGNEMPLVWSDKKDRASLVRELAPNRRAEIAVS